MNALELHNVNKTYGDFALKDVSFSLPQGSIMGFIGENGAGKSTTIKLILNLIHRDGGQIDIFGKDNIEQEWAIKDDIGVVFDENNIPEYMRAGEVSKVLGSIYSRWDSDVFHRYIRDFKLPADKKVKEYSRGMRMKLAIAAALSHDAKLLLLDEATSGLDPMVRNEILDVFMEFIQDEQRSILVSSHIVSDLQKVADYITFIHEGSIMFSSPTYELQERYGMISCPMEELLRLDKAAVAGYRKNAYGVEALVHRQQLPARLQVDPAGIEDIMLYTVKGERI